MADLSAVKTGDRLKVDCLVTERNLTNRIWCLRVGDDDTVPIEKAALEEAAEHIPAPRVFKRGDWVKWNHGKADCIHRHCLFIKVVLTEPALVVIDDNGQTFTVAVEQLSHDKAPE